MFTNRNEEKLKNCVCGGKAEFTSFLATPSVNYFYFAVRCTKCQNKTGRKGSKEAAIKEWNTTI